MDVVEEDEDEKVFMFAGYTTPEKIKEKEDLTDKIQKLGGEVENTGNWNPKCTHVIAAQFETYNVKVLACLASGGWVVTKRFVEKSYRNGTWSNTKAFISHDNVLVHRKRRIDSGGCFKDMKVAFFLESTMRKQAYMDVVKAGLGRVVQNCSMDDILNEEIETQDLTHIVVDVKILSDTDPRHTDFNKLRDYLKQKVKINPVFFIYYRFFFDYLSNPDQNHRPENYSIFNPKILSMARENGDFKSSNNEGTTGGPTSRSGSLPVQQINPNTSCHQQRIPQQFLQQNKKVEILNNKTLDILPTNNSQCEPNKRAAEQLESDSKRQKTESTVEVVAPNVVIDVESSDDDELEVLTMKLRKERGEGVVTNKRIYYDLEPSKQEKIIISIDIPSDSDHEETREASDNESINDEATGAVGTKEAVDQVKDVDLDNEIFFVGTSKQKPEQVIQTKKSKMHKLQLEKIKAREERRQNKEARRAARKSKDSVSPEPMLEPIAVIPTITQTVNVPEPVHAMKPLVKDELLQRILSSISEHQMDTWESIEISNVTCRTTKYDKNKEGVATKKKVVPVEDRVKEEFYNRYTKEPSKSDTSQWDSHTILADEEMNNCVALLEILDYVRCYTNLTTHPTSSILNVIMRDFILNQPESTLALKSYQYITNFMLQFLGRDNLKREEWLYLMLSALRESKNFKEDEKINLESKPEINSCWIFFSTAVNKVVQMPDDKSVCIMLRLLINICQKDFELWWKHHRKTEAKDNRGLSYPILYYLLNGINGSEDLMKNTKKSILNLYEHALRKDLPISDDARRLVAMSGMLFAYLDYRDTYGFISHNKGMKHDLALMLSSIFATADLSSDECYIELSLLKPSWLSYLTSKLFLSKQKKIDPKSLTIKGILENGDKFSASCDTDMIAVMDNYLVKSMASLQIHTVARAYWHFKNLSNKKEGKKEEKKPLSVFCSTSKLVKLTDKSNKTNSNYMRQEGNCVVIGKVVIVEDVNSMIDIINKERVAPSFGVLKSLIFNMSSPDKF